MGELMMMSVSGVNKDMENKNKIEENMIPKNCATCEHSTKMYENTPEGILILESVHYTCQIREEVEYSLYNLPSSCSDYQKDPFILIKL